ncbi:MAG: hypothetical protein ACRD0K_21815 [Egibacteraceae bacterium]
MIVQWCIKGLSLPDDSTAKAVLDTQRGLVCNWWRDVSLISPVEIRKKLTTVNLNLHINYFMAPDPVTGRPFSEVTPFISLSAGTVERDAAAKANFIHRARYTALWFGTDFGRVNNAYLYPCWLVVAPRVSVEIEGIAEEVRDLNSYRSYSDFQTEGEIVAKIIVPDNQIQGCEKWEWDRPNARFIQRWVQSNPRFTPPEQLTNVRELI